MARQVRSDCLATQEWLKGNRQNLVRGPAAQHMRVFPDLAIDNPWLVELPCPSSQMQSPYLLEYEERLLAALRRLTPEAQEALARALGVSGAERARRIGQVFQAIPGSSSAEWLIDVEAEPVLRLTILELLLRESRERKAGG